MADGVDVYPAHHGDGYLETTSDIWFHLTTCWVLGDKLLAPNFKNATMDCMIEQLVRKRFPRVTDGLHNIAYGQTAGNNGLKRLLVDVAIWGWGKKDTAKVECAEFLQDLYARLYEVTIRNGFDSLTGSYYDFQQEDGDGRGSGASDAATDQRSAEQKGHRGPYHAHLRQKYDANLANLQAEAADVGYARLATRY